MAVELTCGLNTADYTEAQEMSLALQKLLAQRLGHLSLMIHRYVSYRASSGCQECRFFLHDVEKKDAMADASLIKKIRKALGGAWEKTDKAYMDLCKRPSPNLSGVTWLKASSVGWILASPLETVHTEGRLAKKKPEVVEEALNFMPQGVRFAVPQYLGGPIVWIYVNGRIVGRHIVDRLKSQHFRMHKTDSGTYVYSRDGKLPLKLSANDRRPIFYPKGEGLFQDA